MSSSSVRVALALSVAALAPAATASAQAPGLDAPRTIQAVGVGSANVTPADRKNNASIVAAVEAAEEKALPLAIEEGREYAQRLATAAGVTLGPLLSVSNAPTSPYGPFGYQIAPFGADRWCGNRRQAIVRRTKSGQRRVVGTRTRRVCVVPPRITQSVTLTYAMV